MTTEHAKNAHPTKRGPGRYHAAVKHGDVRFRTMHSKQQPTGKSGPSLAQKRMIERAEAGTAERARIASDIAAWNVAVVARKRKASA